MSRLILLLLAAVLLFACASTPDLPPLPEVGAAPPDAVVLRELPKTAGELPALGLTGAASLLAAWGVRVLRRRIL